jgi:hypothetical protein
MDRALSWRIRLRECLHARKLAVMADTVRCYPSDPPGQQRWSDRVGYKRHGVVQSLSTHWPGGPIWVRCAMRAFELGTSAPLLPILRATVRLTGASTSDRAGRATATDASAHASPEHNQVAP